MPPVLRSPDAGRSGPARARAIVRLGVAVAFTAIAVLLTTPASAHELAETSATLVVRDGGHLDLRLQVPWADVLRAQWMPKASPQLFLAQVVNQPNADFARSLARVRAALERGARVVAVADTPVAFARWQWPTAVEVQEALRRELMSRLADGERFEHLSRLAATSDVVLARSPATVRVQLPPALGPTLVTIYHPQEQWVKAGELSAPFSLVRR